MRRVLAVLAICIAAAVVSGRASAGEPVVLQLRWDHQYQFAGFYAAQVQGFYEEEGLDVEIRRGFDESGKRLEPIAEVVEGRADFSIGGADILIAIDKGEDLRIVAPIFQQSGVGFISLANRRISSLTELSRLKVARNRGNLSDIEFRAMLLAEGIDPDNVSAIPVGKDFGGLFRGEVDVVATYALSSVPAARVLGHEVSVLRAASYGVDFYGDTLFTHRRIVEQRPDVVDRFTRASLKGWQYALEHREEMIEVITNLPRYIENYGGAEFERYMAELVEELTFYPVVELGHMNPDRWQRMFEYLGSVDVVDRRLNVSEYLFNPTLMQTRRREQITAYLRYGFVAALTVATTAAAWILILRQVVTSRTRELRRASDRAELANRAKSEFLSNVSHELRTPLNAILGFSEILRDQLLGPIGNSRYTEYAVDINRSGAHLLEIVNELLDIARIEAGRAQMQLEPLELIEVVNRAMEMVRVNAHSRGLVLERHVPDGLPPVMGESRALRQILLNLLSNGIKFTPAGGTVAVSARVADERVIVSVSDTGVGIEAADLKRVTEPFARVDNQFTRTHEGTGLGLPIARLLAEGLEGELEIRSTPGEGTTVEVSLRQAPPPEADSEAPAEAEPARRAAPPVAGLPASGAA